jgi:negative regulator of replication initiation
MTLSDANSILLDRVLELQEKNDALLAKVAELQNAIATNDAADEINQAQGIALAAHEYSQIADFVRSVQKMRFAQKFVKPTQAPNKVAALTEQQVDETIENDIYFIELLKHY